MGSNQNFPSETQITHFEIPISDSVQSTSNVKQKGTLENEQYSKMKYKKWIKNE